MAEVGHLHLMVETDGSRHERLVDTVYVVCISLSHWVFTCVSIYIYIWYRMVYIIYIYGT